MSLWKKAAAGAKDSSRTPSGISDDDPDTLAYHEMLKKTSAASEDQTTPRKSIRFAQGIESSNSAKGKSAFGRRKKPQPMDFEGLGDEDHTDDDMLIENNPDEGLESAFPIGSLCDCLCACALAYIRACALAYIRACPLPPGSIKRHFMRRAECPAPPSLNPMPSSSNSLMRSRAWS